VMEFCEGSSLLNAIEHQALDEQTLWHVVRGIANGMAHLAASNIAHRDLACRNVLLDGAWNPKVCDFGMSRMTWSDNSGTQNSTKSDVGPLKWMAPEALQHRQYSEASDVWMFGCTVIEVVTQCEPFPNLAAMQVGTKIIMKQLRPQCAPGTPTAMATVVNRCFEYEPSDRPTFAQIAQGLAPA
jgi:serine/threonine protein kinase